MKIIKDILGALALLFGVGMFVLIILGVTGKLDDKAEQWSGGGSDSAQTGKKESSASKEQGEASSQTEEQKEDAYRYFYAGDTFSFTDGVEVTVVGTGKGTDQESQETYVYVELDISNQSDTDIMAGSYCSGFYGDDYSMGVSSIEYGNDNIFMTVIAKGRRGHGRLYAGCQNYDNLTNIEMEYGDAIIVVKDEKVSPSQEEDGQTLTYGEYVYDDGASVICTASVYLSMGDDEGNYAGNAIHIEVMGYGGHGVINFTGMLEQREDGIYVAHGIKVNENDEMICVFAPQGVGISVESVVHSALYDAEGYYNLESVLNINEVN